jgi:hypothetical protein
VPTQPPGAKDQIEVPGGVVVIDVNRVSRLKAIAWMMANMGFWYSGNTKCDIVIQDPSRTRELLREGPYDGITVNSAVRKMIGEIEQTGLDQFLRTRQIQQAQLGPIRSPSGRINLVESFAPYWWAAKRLIRRKDSSRPGKRGNPSG